MAMSLRQFTLPNKWISNYRSELVKSIMIDVFWYVWHSIWQNDSADLIAKLNDRLCIDYVNLFVSYTKDDRDLFFQVSRTYVAFTNHPGSFGSTNLCRCIPLF
jgi:hypothetical protein